MPSIKQRRRRHINTSGHGFVHANVAAPAAGVDMDTFLTSGAEGAIAVFVPADAAFTTWETASLAAPMADGQRFFIGQIRTNQDGEKVLKKSQNLCYLKEYWTITKRAYAAPANHRVVLGYKAVVAPAGTMNFSSPLVAGTEYSITITRNEYLGSEVDRDPYTFNVKVTTAMVANPALLVTAFVNKINNPTDGAWYGLKEPYVSATATTAGTDYGFELIATRPGDHFFVSFGGEWSWSYASTPTVTIETQGFYGSGTGEQVCWFEEDMLTGDGYTNQNLENQSEYLAPSKYADKALTYTTIMINGVNDGPSYAAPGNYRKKAPIDLELCIPTAYTTMFDTLWSL